VAVMLREGGSIRCRVQKKDAQVMGQEHFRLL